MVVSTFLLGGRRICCACLPAGMDRAGFTSWVFAQLQQIVGPGGVVALTHKGSTAVYHNAPDDLKPVLHQALLVLRWHC